MAEHDDSAQSPPTPPLPQVVTLSNLVDYNPKGGSVLHLTF